MNFSAIPGTSFVGRRSLKNAFFFLKIETRERHTATDLVNFVYYLTSFRLIKQTSSGI